MSQRRRSKNVRPEEPKPRRSAESILFDAASEITGDRIAFAGIRGSQSAAAVATSLPQSQVSCTYFDVFLSDAAKEQHAQLDNLTIHCEPDFPEAEFDTVALALPAHGESELARDLLQQSLQRMATGGRVFAATDNVKDHWLHEQLRTMFGKVTNRAAEQGRLYIGSQPKPLKKVKSFDCWFAMRDGERLIDLYSRPGVFSHRRLDLGARALIESLTVPDGPQAGEIIHDGMCVLDLGCGTGAVGFAAALRGRDVTVHALDANVRALQCTRIGAEKNELPQITTQLEAAGQCENPGEFDLVLANPPYYSNYRIGEIFLQATRMALRSGGRTHFVTKQPEWYAERFTELFDSVSVREIRGYFVVKGTQRT